MSYGVGDQIERKLTARMYEGLPAWRQPRRSAYTSYLKLAKHRRERRRAKLDVECIPQYRRYKGWEW